MTRSMMALVAAVGCLAAEQAQDPLLGIKRIHVEKLNGESSEAIRDMLINALQGAKMFLVTEREDKADAILRGTAENLIYTDVFQSHEGVDARAAIGSSGTAARGSGARRIPSVSVGVGVDESSRSTDRKHEATAAIRLVNRDGDVIWSTTQESQGAKFRGASADVAEKVVKQLMADIEKARRGPAPPSTNP
jgi:hypothetical protein